MKDCETAQGATHASKQTARAFLVSIKHDEANLGKYV